MRFQCMTRCLGLCLIRSNKKIKIDTQGNFRLKKTLYFPQFSKNSEYKI